jgi:hypothetical protein
MDACSCGPLWRGIIFPRNINKMSINGALLRFLSWLRPGLPVSAGTEFFSPYLSKPAGTFGGNGRSRYGSVEESTEGE